MWTQCVFDLKSILIKPIFINKQMFNLLFSLKKKINLKCQHLKVFYKLNCKGKDKRNLYNYFTCQFKLKILCKINVSSKIPLNHTHSEIQYLIINCFGFSTPWRIASPWGLYTPLLTLLTTLFHRLISVEFECWVFSHWFGTHCTYRSLHFILEASWRGLIK